VRLGPNGWIGGWQLVPGNTVLRCRACGHVFAAPRSARRRFPLVGVGVGFLLAAAAVYFFVVMLD
jgi:hypothetical protein